MAVSFSVLIKDYNKPTAAISDITLRNLHLLSAVAFDTIQQVRRHAR